VAEPRVFDEANEAGVASAVEALDRGQLVVFPTDTVYGLAARPERSEGTRAVFAAKDRPRDLTLPVLVADADGAGRLAAEDPRARTLIEQFWPGALTLVLPRSEQSREWDLGAELDTIALRMPDHPVALSILRRSGPLAVTSANRSGEPTPNDCEGVRSMLGDSVAVYLCAGPLPGGTASTVVDLASGEPRVLREGALPAERVLAAL
jgi:tRNA threonylcarbamoyl adenosine modification protein (Sua5/YciO/YrdC/YwlC family)